MKIAVLGTGMVGRAHAAKLAELGHEVTIGTRDVAKTTSETKPDQMGNPPFSQWQKEHSHVKLETFENAVKNTDMILEALHGAVAVEVLKALESSLTGTIITCKGAISQGNLNPLLSP